MYIFSQEFIDFVEECLIKDMHEANATGNEEISTRAGLTFISFQNNPVKWIRSIDRDYLMWFIHSFTS